MDNKTISVHRALAELKLLDNKIEKGIAALALVSVQQKHKKIEGRYDSDEFQANQKSAWDSTIDLIANKQKIKSALVKSNAATTIVVGGKTFTVADAITFKALLQHKKLLLNHLLARKQKVEAILSHNNEEKERRLQKLLESSFQDVSKATKDDLQKTTDVFNQNNEWSFVDPLRIDDKIKDLQKEIGNFETEIDAALSESNAVTKITIQ